MTLTYKSVSVTYRYKIKNNHKDVQNVILINEIRKRDKKEDDGEGRIITASC